MRDLDAPESPATGHSTHVARWWDPEQGGKVHCYLCPRHCHIGPGQSGFCFIRANEGGNLVSLGYAHPAALQVDPIEKKPLNHFLPGTKVFSIGTAGCNMGCFFCQNWSISKSKSDQRRSTYMPPEEVVEMAIENDCPSIAFTYNEPIIWGEYVIDICKVAHAHGLKTVMVSNGYVTYEAFHDIYDHIDAANIDLKSFTEKFYGGTTLTHLQPVLDTLKWLKNETSVWFEITNLLIPTLNDARAETRALCEWILENLGPDVPLHFTAFHPDFKLLDKPRTPEETLHAARAIALEVGLHYVYEGNIRSGNENTVCPSCDSLLIRRNWHNVQENRLLLTTSGHLQSLAPPLHNSTSANTSERVAGAGDPRTIGSDDARTYAQDCGPKQIHSERASVRFVGETVPPCPVPDQRTYPVSSVTPGPKQDQPHSVTNRLLPDPVSSQKPYAENSAPGHPSSRIPQTLTSKAHGHPAPNRNESTCKTMSPEPMPSKPEATKERPPLNPALKQDRSTREMMSPDPIPSEPEPEVTKEGPPLHPAWKQNRSTRDSMSPEPAPSEPEPEVIRHQVSRSELALNRNLTVAKATPQAPMLSELRLDAEVSLHPPILNPSQPEPLSTQLTDARCPRCATNVPGRWSVARTPPPSPNKHNMY